MSLLPDASSWEIELDGLRVVYGGGAAGRLGELAAGLGAHHVLLVSDPGLKRTGHVAAAEKSLAGSGLSATIYDAVGENPTEAEVDAGARAARAAGAIDLIVGLGGGSAMDCAKGINFVLAGGGRMRDYQGSGKAAGTLLPSIGVPTTAGTGSEAQSYALITHDETHAKMACGDPQARFKTVILDPALTATQPREVAALTGIDAMTHAIESYVSKARNDVSQEFAAEAWRRLAGAFEAALDDPADPGPGGEMLLGAHLAGLAIEHSMLGAAHACANPLTARFGVTHGAAVGLMLPAVMRFNEPEVGEFYNFLHESGSRPPGTPDTLVQRFETLRRTAGLPEQLRDYGIRRDCLNELAREAATQWTAGFNPRPVGARELLEIYDSAY